MTFPGTISHLPTPPENENTSEDDFLTNVQFKSNTKGFPPSLAIIIGGYE